MDENVRKLRVGIFVLMAIVILGILILVNSEGWVSQYDIYVKSFRAPGVTVGTPVRKNGILIGRVKEVFEDDEGLVVLRIGINTGSNIYENEICKIGTESVLGDAKLEFLPLERDERGPRVQPEHTMSTVSIQKNPMDFVAELSDLQPQFKKTLIAIEDAGRRVDQAGKEAGDVFQSIEKTFQDESGEFNKLIKDMRLMSQKGQFALDRFNDMFDSIKNVFDDPEIKREFKRTLKEIPLIFEEIRITVEDTRTAVQKFGKLPEKFDKTLGNIEVFSESLKENGPEILTRVNTSLDSIDKFVSELKGVSELLERFKNADGTIVKLFEDDDLYNSVLEAVENVKKETIRIKPLVSDLRLFADSLARDPSIVGVKGATDLRPPKTGYKGSAGRDRWFK